MTSARFCLLGLVALMAGSLAVAAPVPKQKKKHSLLDEMQGRWDMITMSGGNALAQTGQSWTFTENRVLNQYRPNAAPTEATIELNEQQEPATLDWVHNPTNRSLAIVKMEGDELVFCFVGQHAPRPKKFDPAEGVVYRFKRSTLEK